MSECKDCGRDDGHWIGCAAATRELEADGWKVVENGNFSVATNADVCAYGDCMDPKRPKGKGRAPIYCTAHSDPKNRK